MQPGGDPLVLCFVDFVSPAHAATAMDALQGKICFLFFNSWNDSIMHFLANPMHSISLFPLTC